jgi:metallo-beta-lactamase family protein
MPAEQGNGIFSIRHHGAVNGVTGSCHELSIKQGDSQQGVLIDCGLFQGAEISDSSDELDQLKIDFPIEHIKALVVTHVHIDHVGRIPYLLAAGFSGPIICSRASAILLPLVLEDALKIGFTRNERLIKSFLSKIADQIVALDFNRWHTIISSEQTSLKVKLKEAGHILGSAYAEFSVIQGKNDQRVIFSGDLGPPYTPILSSPKSPYRADCLVIESTYGDKIHENRRTRIKRLEAIIISALQDKGVILIPAFSIGRTQELLYEIESLMHKLSGQKIAQNLNWQDLEVIVDSPLAAQFNKAYRSLKPFWDAEARAKVKAKRHPLNFEQLLTIDDHATHLQTVEYLVKTARPAIVIAASGMCTGGRIVNYLKALLPDKRNDILFVGYQARGTAGRDIQKYGPQNGYVELDGQRYDIQASVHTLGGYSAHADQFDLLKFIRRIRHKPREIRIVHGDDDAKLALKDAIQTLYDVNVIIPVGD